MAENISFFLKVNICNWQLLIFALCTKIHLRYEGKDCDPYYEGKNRWVCLCMMYLFIHAKMYNFKAFPILNCRKYQWFVTFFILVLVNKICKCYSKSCLTYNLIIIISDLFNFHAMFISEVNYFKYANFYNFLPIF